MPKILIHILLFIAFSFTLFAQAPLGELKEIYVSSEKDTIVVNRKYGPLWLGITAGPTYNLTFGKMFYPAAQLFPEAPLDIYNPELPFASLSGLGGYNIGLTADYQPAGDRFGYSANLIVWDLRYLSAETETFNQANNSKFDATAKLNYLTLAPSIRYNLKTEGFYAFAGPTIEISLYNKVEHDYNFVNSANIDHIRSFKLNNVNTRIGLNFGIGYEFVVAEINRQSRIRMNPYLSMHLGTDYFGEYKYADSLNPNKIAINNPNYNTFSIKAGLSIKWGKDEETYDTLQFNPFYVAPVDAMASAISKKNVQFSGFKQFYLVEPSEIPYVAVSQVAAKVEATKVIPPDTASIAVVKPVEVKEPKAPDFKKMNISIGRSKKFNYSTSNAVELTKDMREYFEALAQFLKENPNVEIRMQGHSDNQGTPQQQQKWSEDRVNRIQSFLVDKGVARRRILLSALAARSGIAPNNTEDGRRQNRRVELQIVGK